MKIARFALVAFTTLSIALTAGEPVRGQGVAYQWNFNGATVPGTTVAPSTFPSGRIGSATTIAGVTTTAAGGLADGGSTDTTAGSNNRGWNTTTYAAQGAQSGERGVQFRADLTNQSNLVFRFDQRHSPTSSKFLLVQYTLDVSAASPTWTDAGTFQAYGRDPLAGGNTWYNNRTIDLSAVSGANNNPNFAVRVVSIFDPATGISYSPSNPTSSYTTGGTWRFDMATLSSGAVWIGGSGNSLAAGANFQLGSPPFAGTETLLLGSAGGSNTNVEVASSARQFDQIIFQAGAPSYTISGSETLVLNAGLVNNATNAQTISTPSVTFGQSNAIQLSNGSQLTFSSDVEFDNFLSLIGSGTVVFNNTVQGSISSITLSNPSRPTIRVGPGATLAGSNFQGTSGADAGFTIVVYSGGTLRAGDPAGVGKMTVGASGTNLASVTLEAGASLGIRVTSAGSPDAAKTGGSSNGSNNNLLEVLGNGALSINATTKYIVDGTNANFAPDQTYSYKIAQGPNSQASLDITDQSLFSTVGFNAADHRFSITGDTNGAVFLNISPVPEPAMVLGIAAGALGLGGVVRRRLRARQQAVQV